MLKYLWIVVPFFVFGCQASTGDGDTLTVQLSRADGTSPFAHMLGFSKAEDPSEDDFWARIRPAVIGIPDSLLQPELYAEHMQIEQLAFHGYHIGEMDSSEYASWADDASYDSTLYTAAYVDQEVMYVMAFTADSQRVVLFDTDNDEDFADEVVHTFPAMDDERDWRETVLLLPRVEVSFDFFDGEEVVTSSLPVLVDPLNKFAISRNAVVFGSEMYHTGTLTVKGEQYAWWVADVVKSGLFDKQYTRVWFEPIDGAGFPERPLAQLARREEMVKDTTEKPLPEGYYPSIPEPYEIGDVIKLAGESFELAAIDMEGTTLTLNRTAFDEIGLRTGMTAPDFEGPTLEGGTAHLADFRGKYVLLDFWGTWCAPCIGEVPVLREAYEAYPRDVFEILAIANDDLEPLEKFVEEEQLPWTQIVRLEDDLSLLQIVEQYRVTGYPTTFLLDPDGVIIAREGELRGERLAKTLAKYLGSR